MLCLNRNEIESKEERQRGRDRNPLIKGISLEGLKNSLKMQKQIHLHRYFSQDIANYHNKDDVGGIAGSGECLQEQSQSVYLLWENY